MQLVLSFGGKPTALTLEWFFIAMFGLLVACNGAFWAEKYKTNVTLESLVTDRFFPGRIRRRSLFDNVPSTHRWQLLGMRHFGARVGDVSVSQSFQIVLLKRNWNGSQGGSRWTTNSTRKCGSVVVYFFEMGNPVVPTLENHGTDPAFVRQSHVVFTHGDHFWAFVRTRVVVFKNLALWSEAVVHMI